MDYLWIFYGFFNGFFMIFLWIFFRVQYVKNSGNYSYTCSEVLDYYYYYYPLFSLTFFSAVNSKIKYFSCSFTYSCYFYWVVSLGLVFFFPACGGQIVNGDIVTVKIKLRVCYNYFSPPAAGK